MFNGIYENYDSAEQNLTSITNLFDGHIWTGTVRYWTENSINNAKNPKHPFEWYLREFITLLATEAFSAKRY